MKHSWFVTVVFLCLFVVSQYVGLALLSASTNVSENDLGEVEVSFSETVLVERPRLMGWESVIYIIIGVAIGTLILIFLANKRQVNIWRIWFLLAVWLSMTIALGVVFSGAVIWVPLVVALVLALWKVYAPNVFIQNITEVLTYSGIAVLLVPILNVVSVFIILVIFSFYDAYAVWKSKHMIKMAKFTSDANLFPGLLISYSVSKDNRTKFFPFFGERKLGVSSVKSNKYVKYDKSSSVAPKPPLVKKVNGSEKNSVSGSGSGSSDDRKTGVLGGGDVVFPLLFAGVVMLSLLGNGYSRQEAFSLAFVVVAGAVASLLFLFYIGKKDRFYPAMPFITTGCLIGYGVVLLIV